MNRLVVACLVGTFGAFAFGCASSAVGDPCTPELEFDPLSGGAASKDLHIDVNSVQCDTRVCLSHYFQGRVSCPYGNNKMRGQNALMRPCRQVGNNRGWYTLEGDPTHDLCCPILGDVQETPIALPVPPQCLDRTAQDAVYCTCKCDVPNDPEIDRSKVVLCSCPDGFSCTPLCDRVNGDCALLGRGKWGSYCVKTGRKGSDFKPNSIAAGCMSLTDTVPPPTH